jgi:phosphate transport system permease protein
MGTITTPSTTELVQRELRGRRTDVPGLLFSGALLLALFVALGVLVVLLVDVLQDAIPTFAERGTDYLTRNPSSRASRAGILGPILGTVLIGGFVVVLSFPIGIASAIYLEEYAPRNAFTRLIDVNIRNLAGVPSIVYGLLGLSVLVEAGAAVTGGRTLFSAGVTMAILVLPIVIITSAEAIRAVPNEIREAGFGVGATRWEIIRAHVLPYALPGVLTGTILALARALGEAAPLILVGAVIGVRFGGELGLFQPVFALPVTIYDWARNPDVAFRDQLVPAAILVLLAIVLLANSAAILLRNRYDKRR